jgi:Fuc2NAc and GlcNAc transferase
MLYALFAVFILSLMLTFAALRYATARNIMDTPNHRSSHIVPTPRGGGVAFVVAFLIVIPFLVHLDLVSYYGSFALIGAGLFLAILGFLDDHQSIPPYWRLFGHFSACVLALYWLDGMPPISFFYWTLSAGWIANGLAVVYLVWLLNLYNFMDGIDGLAGVEAISVCLGAALLYWIRGDMVLIVLPLFLAASVAGFLVWNFPPARIFMGDAGSSFLGFILGVLSIKAAAVSSDLFWSWLILLGSFILDATLTLIRRALRGERVQDAHRTHAYQKATICFNKHLPVTLAVLLINVLWLLPIAILVGLGFLKGFTGLLIAYAPLVIIVVQFKAGQQD